MTAAIHSARSDQIVVEGQGVLRLSALAIKRLAELDGLVIDRQ